MNNNINDTSMEDSGGKKVNLQAQEAPRPGALPRFQSQPSSPPNPAKYQQSSHACKVTTLETMQTL